MVKCPEEWVVWTQAWCLEQTWWAIWTWVRCKACQIWEWWVLKINNNNLSNHNHQVVASNHKLEVHSSQMPLAICLVSNSNHQHFNHSHSNLPPLVPFNNLLLQELVTLVGFSQQLHSNNKTNLVDFNLHQLNSNSLVAFNLLLLSSSSNSLETFNKHLLNQLRLVRKMLMVDLWIFQILLEKLPKRMIIKV